MSNLHDAGRGSSQQCAEVEIGPREGLFRFGGLVKLTGAGAMPGKKPASTVIQESVAHYSSGRRVASHPKYRPDIDGLRAIAVLSVVAFHAFPSSIKGGFIGVDIFFVISGFLISTILFENLDRGTFSFAEFYARRIKRIFPALLLVLIATYAFGWFALLAEEYKQLGKHIAAGVGFMSNIVLWKEAGYFDNAAETKPLLHLWSLGIEEQFYLVWPLLLWLAFKQRFNLVTITIVLTIVSFYLNVNGVEKDAVATFYSPQTRLWELLCGSLLAWATLYKKEAYANIKTKLGGWLGHFLCIEAPQADGNTLPNFVSWIGLLVLAYGFVKINKGFNFPGEWAVVPVVGSVLLISAGPTAWINRIVLSNRLAVWFGLISFPLYLWHWPLLSFARIVESEAPSRNIRIAAVVLSVVLAWLTYELVERPIRLGKYSKAKVPVLVLLMVIVGYVGYSTYSRDGLGFRTNATLKGFSFNGDTGHLEYHKYIAEKYFLCTPNDVAKEALKWEGFARCMQSKPNADVEVALVGDSHAEHLFLGLAEALPTKNVAFYIKRTAPFIDNPEFENIFKAVLQSKSIKDVILTMRWNIRVSELPAGSSLEDKLLETIDALSKAGKVVYLTDDVPVFPFGPEKCKGRRWLGSYNPRCEMSYENAKLQSVVYLRSLMKVVERRPEVKVLNLGKYFCEDGLCSMTKGDKIFYRDNNHLNLNGSLLVGRRLVEDNVGFFD